MYLVIELNFNGPPVRVRYGSIGLQARTGRVMESNTFDNARISIKKSKKNQMSLIAGPRDKCGGKNPFKRIAEVSL